MVIFTIKARTRKAAIRKFRREFPKRLVIVRVRWDQSSPRKGGNRSYLMFVRNRRKR